MFIWHIQEMQKKVQTFTIVFFKIFLHDPVQVCFPHFIEEILTSQISQCFGKTGKKSESLTSALSKI